MREPFWRAQTQYWYIEKNGKQVRLSKLGDRDPDGGDRKHPPAAVQNEWHRLMREGSPEDLQVGDLFAAFLTSLPEGGENRKTTRRQLMKFESFIGKETPVSRLRPLELTNYLKTKPNWRPSSVRTFVNRLHAALNWGVRQGIVEKNPISSTPGYKREGRNERRRGVISDADRRLAEENAAPEFRAVLVALRESGARPSEIANARIEKVFLDDGYLLVPNKTAHQTGQAERRIYLSPAMKELLKERIAGRAEGHVFLNRLGKPWTIQSLKKRWEWLRARTGVKGSLRTYRRTFISTAINDTNVNPALVAQLAGHSIDILFNHYLEENPEALRKAVEAITKTSGRPRAGSR
jgi:integrase